MQPLPFPNHLLVNSKIVSNPMKTIRLSLFSFVLVFVSLAVSAQSTAPALSAYYGVKNALVATDAAKAKTQATTLVAALGKVGSATLSAADKKALASAKTSAATISQTTEVAAQRKAFETLSTNMIMLVKATKPAKTYVQYCPMVKASWLSDSKDIKNPYYGNQMLTCGSVKEEI